MKHLGRVIAVGAGSTITATVLWRFASQRRSGVDWRPPRPRTMFSPLAARVIGAGTPIVLLHGLGASGDYWGSVYDRLGDGHRLVVPDLLGFGASPRPSAGYGPDEHVGEFKHASMPHTSNNPQSSSPTRQAPPSRCGSQQPARNAYAP